MVGDTFLLFAGGLPPPTSYRLRHRYTGRADADRVSSYSEGIGRQPGQLQQRQRHSRRSYTRWGAHKLEGGLWKSHASALSSALGNLDRTRKRRVELEHERPCEHVPVTSHGESCYGQPARGVCRQGRGDSSLGSSRRAAGRRCTTSTSALGTVQKRIHPPVKEHRSTIGSSRRVLSPAACGSQSSTGPTRLGQPSTTHVRP